MRHSGELRQKRTCWIDANENERSVTVPLAVKNRGLRANRQPGEMSRRQEKFEECESGCAYNGITDVLSNMLMKVQRDTVSENSVHNPCVSLTMVWT